MSLEFIFYVLLFFLFLLVFYSRKISQDLESSGGYGIIFDLIRGVKYLTVFGIVLYLLDFIIKYRSG